MGLAWDNVMLARIYYEVLPLRKGEVNCYFDVTYALSVSLCITLWQSACFCCLKNMTKIQTETPQFLTVHC